MALSLNPNSLKSFKFPGYRLATRRFSSFHRFSIELRSTDCLGHSVTAICFFRHSSVALATDPPTTRVLAQFFGQTFIAPVPIHWPLNVAKLSCTLSNKIAQSIMLPPPCLQDGLQITVNGIRAATISRRVMITLTIKIVDD